jgi:putative redox protein
VLTVRLYAERKQWPLDRVEARVSRDPGTGKIASIALALVLGGDLSDEQRGRLAEIAGRCPIHRTLMEGVQITHA